MSVSRNISGLIIVYTIQNIATVALLLKLNLFEFFIYNAKKHGQTVNAFPLNTPYIYNRFYS